MAMVVQHNLTAMNANRQLGVITSGQSKSSEKLSSGYRINRASDDAAGLKISEKMRSQVRGLNRASTNAQDGVSLIQTAEGALNEAHSILQRMNELAVQGANDTNESIDREAINQELDQLTQELDRISETTQFNKQNLLDGTFQDKNLHVGANNNQKIAISIDNMNAETLGLRSIKGTELGDRQSGVKPTQVVYKGYTYDYDLKKTAAQNQAAAISAFKGAISRAANEDQYAMQTDKVTGSVYYKDTAGNTTTTSTAGHFSKVDLVGSVKISQTTSHVGIKASAVLNSNGTAFTTKQEMSTWTATSFVNGGTASKGTSYKWVSGSSDSSTTRYQTAKSAMLVDIQNAKSAMSADISDNFEKYLKTDKVTADDQTVAAEYKEFVMKKPEVSSYAKANATIDAVQEAINRVSSQRSALGAIQNRLEHTIANLDNVAENTQAAESRIRDTDIASEMVEYSKNQILAQAGQSMLAQGNQSTQGVLSLLQ